MIKNVRFFSTVFIALSMLSWSQIRALCVCFYIALTNRSLNWFQISEICVYIIVTVLARLSWSRISYFCKVSVYIRSSECWWLTGGSISSQPDRSLAEGNSGVSTAATLWDLCQGQGEGLVWENLQVKITTGIIINTRLLVSQLGEKQKPPMVLAFKIKEWVSYAVSQVMLAKLLAYSS